MKEKNILYILFQVVNKNNGMTFIGKTNKSLSKIRSKYNNAYKHAPIEKLSFIEASIYNEGKDVFEWSIIPSSGIKEDVEILKKTLIKKLRENKKSYNLRVKPYINSRGISHFSLEGKFLGSYPSKKIASEHTGILPSSIRSSCYGTCLTIKENIFLFTTDFSTEKEMIKEVQRRIEKYERRMEHQKPKEVLQFSLNGELLNSYASTRIASNETLISMSSIKNCCFGKGRTIKGYIFVFPKLFRNHEEMLAEVNLRVKDNITYLKKRGRKAQLEAISNL